MSRCLVLGMSNVGKSCFAINFAEYMGLKEIKMTIKEPAGYKTIHTYLINEAKAELISVHPNRTRSLYSLDLDLPIGKGKGRLTLIDSCGLSDGIHPDEQVRKAMAHTIRQIKGSEIVLHMIDLWRFIKNSDRKLAIIDEMIMNYVSKPQAYAILANKIDLSGTESGLEYLKNTLKKIKIIPISALYQTGFSEVKSFVGRNL